MPDPKKKKRIPSSIKRKSTTVKGSRGALTTTTTTVKKFKGKNVSYDTAYKNRDQKTYGNMTKAEYIKVAKKTPTRRKNSGLIENETRVTKTKGIANVSTSPSTKLAKRTPPRRKLTRETLKSVFESDAPRHIKLKVGREYRKENPLTPQQYQRNVDLQKKRTKKAKIKKTIKNIFAPSPFTRKTARPRKGGCFN